MKTTIKKEIVDWIKTIALAITLALLITSFIEPTLVQQTSMYPTLDNNDYLLLHKRAYSNNKVPHYGDIIVFRSDLELPNGKKKNLVKRVIGIGGDHIQIREGIVFRNNEMLTENYINGKVTDGLVDEIVPNGQIFVMGDNRPNGNSIDSRDPSIGTIAEDRIVGRVFIRLFPFNKIQTF